MASSRRRVEDQVRDAPRPIEVADHAVLRAAAWPIETADLFAAPELARLASGVAHAEQLVDERRTRMLHVLHRAIPSIGDRAARAWLLDVKRRIYAGLAPLPEPPDEILASLSSSTPDAVRELCAEREVRLEADRSRRRFDEAFEQELVEQRRALRRATADPRFGRALVIADRELADRWARHCGTQVAGVTRRARAERLERAVFRFLMRAAGRSTPQGTWAGVATVEPFPAGSTAACAPQPVFDLTPRNARIRATVDLSPFAAVVAALARTPRYLNSYPLRLNATAHRDGPSWWYQSEIGAEHRWTAVPDDPITTVLVEAFADREPHRAPPLLDALAALTPTPASARGALIGALEGLIEADVLQSDLHLPLAPEAVGDALDTVASRLLEQDLPPWRAASDETARLCGRLEVEFESLDPTEVGRIIGSIEECLQGLLTAFGLDPTLAGPGVHIDLGLPYEARWNHALRERASGAVSAILGFHAVEGVAEAFRSDTVDRLATGAPSPGQGTALLPWLRRLEAGGPAGSWKGRREERGAFWERVLEPVRDRASHELPPSVVRRWPVAGPAGALLVSIDGSCRLRAEWGRPQPALFASRFTGLLHPGPAGDAGVVGELRARFDAWTASGVTAAEVVGEDPVSLNAAVRPRLTAVELGARGRRGPGLDELSVCFDHGRPWLRREVPGERLVAVYGSAVLIGSRDPCSRAMFDLAMGHGWEMVSVGFPSIEAETRWHHLPELVLPGGTVLSAERWTLDEATAAGLHAGSGASQYLAWRCFADRFGVPPLVWAGGTSDSEEPRLLVRTDSPLSVACMLRSLRPAHQGAVLTALHGDPAEWLVCDDAGRHHVAELAVSWWDDGYWERLERCPLTGSTEEEG